MLEHGSPPVFRLFHLAGVKTQGPGETCSKPDGYDCISGICDVGTCAGAVETLLLVLSGIHVSHVSRRLSTKLACKLYHGVGGMLLATQ